MAETLGNNYQQMNKRNSVAFTYEGCHLHVQVGNFSDYPRNYALMLHFLHLTYET